MEYNTFGTLADYIDHPQLFKAYPQLKDVKIGFITEDVFYVTYSHRGNIITLNFNLPKEEMKSNLIHEIQHAIQEIEGFANGSNVEYWESKGSDNPYGVYRKTAGEIEARDSQKRLEYTATQRKNIRPDIDRTNVLFADDKISYLNKNNFDEQVNDALKGKIDKRNALFVSNTSNILLRIGMQQLPMLYTQSHLNNAIKPKSLKNMHAHGLTVEQIKYMPQVIERPAVVMDSLSSNNDIVLVSDKLDNDGAPIILVVHPNGKGVYELIAQPSNFIKSFYGKDNNFNGYIGRAIKENKILFIDKSKSQSLYQQIGLQLPNGFNKLGFDKIIHRSNNIVNNHSVQKEENNPDFQYQMRDAEFEDVNFKYSYNELINNPDMKITVIDDSVKYTPNSEVRKSIVNQAVKNALAV